VEDHPLNAAITILNQGGATMYAILLCSITLLTLVLERFLYFRKKDSPGDELYQETTRCLKEGKLDEGAARLQKEDSSFARVYEAALSRAELPRDDIEKALATTISEENLGFEKNLAYIGTLAVISPFIGLLGTVLGIMRAFQDIALKGATGPAVVAKGVAEALVATAAGLFVAIPASIFFNYFKNRGKSLSLKLKIAGSRFAELLSLRAAGKKLPGALAMEKEGEES
jgi:biopolymer transport protein ExbB